MMSSLFTGVSGLKANSLQMAVIGDNISNVNTIAFKCNSAAFANVLRSSLAGATGNEIGNGVHLWGMSPLWTQGSMEKTSNSTDLAIDGRGFFVLEDANQEKFYSRAGAFHFDDIGNLVNPQGLVVQGYKYTDGEIGSDLANITIPSGTSPPNATTEMDMNINLDSRSTIEADYYQLEVDPDGTEDSNDEFILTANNDVENPEDIQFEIVDSEGGGASITVAGNKITYDLGGETDIKAQDIVTEINEHTDASDLVSAEVDGDGETVVDSEFAAAYLQPAVTYASATIFEGEAYELTFTAKESGSDANEFQIEIVDEGAEGFDVTVDGNSIIVNLGGADPAPDPETFAGNFNDDEDVQDLVEAEATAETAGGNVETISAFNLEGGGDVDPATYATSLTVYDSLGDPITLTVQFTFAGDNTWNWEATTNKGTCEGSGSVTFNEDGQLTEPATDPTISISDLDNGADDLSITWAMTDNENFTSYSLRSMTTFQSQDGYTAGAVQSVSVDENGIVSGVYSNGQLFPLFQIALADFPSYPGLEALGENLYAESFDSGQPTTGIAGSGTLGSVSPSSLEMSNVDLATEFVKMITTQRAFQANSRVISTSDEILQELINVKR